MAKNKADIRRESGDVVVYDASGKECFRRPYSPQVVSLAHTIYMGCRYKPKGE